MTADEAAQRATVGLIVLRDGVVSWHNDAADALVNPHGAAWGGSTAPLDVLAPVRPGARRIPVRWPSPTGGTRWWQVTCSRLDPGGSSLLYEITDETTEPDADGTRVGPPAAQWRLARMEAMAGVGSWIWDVREDVIECSEALVRQFGLETGTRLDFAGYRRLLHPEEAPAIESMLADAVRELRSFSLTHRILVGKGGEERIFECNGEVLADSDGAPIRLFGTARDVTVHHRAEQELAYLAEHDPLTGIANRRQIASRLAECGLRPGGAALLLVDIDNFKDINDLHGHAAGDRVIRRVAATMAAEIGSAGVPGRLGATSSRWSSRAATPRPGWRWPSGSAARWGGCRCSMRTSARCGSR